jgi:mycothiol synthase
VESFARVEHLSPDEVAEVVALTQAAGDADGAHPLSEHVTLHLRSGGDEPAVHLLARSAGELVGYAHVDTTDPVEGASAEMCVHPLHRRRGLGRLLVLGAIAAAQEQDVNGRLRLWAHGDHPSANALALSLGFVRDRMLFQLRRSLLAPVPTPALPAGVRLRSFQPGKDNAAWLELNARAFVGLPDQGRWTERDLQARLAESWFSPDGFLLAERTNDRALLGFHWTKVHGGRHHHHGHDQIGEVYVLGVDPAAQGTGLGAALTLAGLRHLRDVGLHQVMLYVDEANPTAVALYRRLGFAHWAADVCYRRAGQTARM